MSENADQAGFRLEQVGGPPLAVPNIDLRERVLLGRGTDCTVILADAVISRRHAQVESRAGKLWLTDLDSRAGTFLNDLRLDSNAPVSLNAHDRVRLGAWRFRVRASGAPLTQMGNKVGSTSLAGVTQYAHPVMAAEARLELLVEFAAASSQSPNLYALAELALTYAMRGSGAARASAWEAAEGSPMLHVPDNFHPIADRDGMQAASTGGVVRVDRNLANHLCTVIAPICVDGEALGYMQLEFANSRPSTEAMELVHALSRLTGLSVAAIERREAEIRVLRLREDLQAAHAVQLGIQPPEKGEFPGFRYALHVHPGRVVAGDIVDVFAIDEHRSAIILGDVSGAGFGAAMLMSATQAYLHAELTETGDAGVAATRCNRYLARLGGGRFVTAWIAVYDAKTNVLSVVDAGHGHARLRNPDATQVGTNLIGSIPLGIDAGAQFSAEILHPQSGSRCLLFSDGVAEHVNDEGQHFSDRLSRVLLHSHSADQDVEITLSALKMHGNGRLPDDDATFMSVQWQSLQS